MKAPRAIHATQKEKNNMKIIPLFAFLVLTFSVNGQSVLKGKVSFVTSKNVYVKFVSTEGISVGDTLFSNSSKKPKPCLVVNRLSSSSSVCTPLAGFSFQKGDPIESKQIVKKKVEKEKKTDDKKSGIDSPLAGKKATKKVRVIDTHAQRLRGRVTAASYSNIREQRSPSNRMVYRMSFYGDNIANSNVSVSSNINYREIYDARYEKADRDTKILRVYDLAATYRADSSFSITLGRKINYKASSLGVIDGIQGEKFLGKYYVGGILGFRPDYQNYGINTDLLEYGTYVGHVTQGKKIYSQTTLGLLEQRFLGKVDRRYTYFQHSSNWHRKLNMFGSFEIDLFQNINGKKSSDFRLTNIFVSSRYRFSRRFSLGVSYDSRLRVIYYETFKTDIERLLTDEARQGFRLRLNARPFKYLNVGASAGKRFQRDGQNKSENINGYASYSNLPFIGGRFSVNYNRNESNYLVSNILGYRYSRSFNSGKFGTEFYYRMVHYDYLISELAPKLNYFGTTLRYRLSRALAFSILGEYVPDKISDKYRVNGRLTYRFSQKKSKKK